MKDGYWSSIAVASAIRKALFYSPDYTPETPVKPRWEEGEEEGEIVWVDFEEFLQEEQSPVPEEVAEEVPVKEIDAEEFDKQWEELEDEESIREILRNFGLDEEELSSKKKNKPSP